MLLLVLQPILLQLHLPVMPGILLLQLLVIHLLLLPPILGVSILVLPSILHFLKTILLQMVAELQTQELVLELPYMVPRVVTRVEVEKIEVKEVRI